MYVWYHTGSLFVKDQIEQDSSYVQRKVPWLW